jgi:hypothetical protein
VTDIRDEFDRVIRAGAAQTAFLAERLDQWGVAILNAIDSRPSVPSRIIQTSSIGAPMPGTPVALGVGQSDVIAITIADQNGNTIEGVGLDTGATVTVAPDGTVLAAVLSADQTSVEVTQVGPAGDGVSVTVNGTVNGVAMTPDPTVYDAAGATVTPPAPVPTSIVQTPAPPT